jgi:lambda family phage portal protein
MRGTLPRGIVDRVRRYLGGRPAPATAGRPGQPVDAPANSARPRPRLNAAYDAAQDSVHSERHWANADNLSAAAANGPIIRRKLRSRARYEAQESNSYAKGICLTLANDTIGTGPRLQMLTTNGEANARIERAFARWADAVHLSEKLRLSRLARAVDGEAFLQFITNPKLTTPIQLDLRPVEADQVTTPFLEPLARNAVDGIEFDAAGNPTVYHVLREHPGNLAWVTAVGEVNRVPAELMIHLFRCDRPGQCRGVPEITPALPLFAQLRRFTLAVIAAAETAASFGGVVYTDSPALEKLANVDPLDPIELEMRQFLTLPAGWKMGQIASEHPSTTYDMFKREILNEIARCLNMPRNVAAGDSSDYNYASGRLDHQTYYRSIRIDQVYYEVSCLDRILAAWLDEAVLIEGLLPDDVGPIEEWDHQWFWDGAEHVDPAKEANAQATRLTSNTTTLAAEFAKQGKDWEVEIRQRAKELDLLRELGVAVAADPQAQPQGPARPGDDDEDEDEKSTDREARRAKAA